MHARPPRSIGHKTHPKPKGRARTMRTRGDSFAVAWATLDTRVLGAPPQWPTATLRQHPVSVPAGGPRVPHAELRCGHAVRPGPWRVRGARGPGRRSWRRALSCTLCSAAVDGAAEGGRPDSHRPAERRARARNRPRECRAPSTWGSVVSTVTSPFSTDTPCGRLLHGPQKTAATASPFLKVLICVATGGNLVRSESLHAALKSFCEMQRKVKAREVEKAIGNGQRPSDGLPLTSRRLRLSPKLLPSAQVAALPGPPISVPKRPAPRGQVLGSPGQHGLFC